MKGPAVRRKRGRRDPLRVCIVDDHCDALSKIHSAIRRGDLPFTDLHFLHFDAHPDLMVTPDMPAETCFRPQELYRTLAASEGGIAEWILPLVYQGHLSRLHWIRPAWARQFIDGDHQFCVGQVKTTGTLRVSSMAPYFVDDRLYCSEEDMTERKPLHLRVSLVPEEDLSSMKPWVGGELAGSSEFSGSPHRTSRAAVGIDFSQRAERRGMTHESSGMADETGSASATNGQGLTQTTPSATGPDISASDDVRSMPWVLDICLDYFTTENPFMVELEDHIGKEDAAVVREFYEKPTFRGAATSLPHGTQLEHERIFKTEVERLLRFRSACNEDVVEAASAGAQETKQNGSLICAAQRITRPSYARATGPGAGRSRCLEQKKADGSVALVRSDEMDHGETNKADVAVGLRRLAELFDPKGGDRLLVEKFASVVGRMGREGREKVAWADHCACLPRHLATREEVAVSVRKVEAFLRSLLSAGSGSSSSVVCRGRPGVITVARSVQDAYVPTEMVAFVESEVLTMLTRLYGNMGNPRVHGVGDDRGLEFCYEEGLRPTNELITDV